MREWIMTLIGRGDFLTIVYFILSLIGAIVLFKLLKSTAVIKKAGYQAGGALAGFLLIYIALVSSSERLSKNEKSCEPEPWTVEGTIKKEGEETHEGIIIKYTPPEPSTKTDERGSFSLRDVKLGEGKWPELRLESKNYFPLSIELNETTAEKDIKKKKIKLKNIEKLGKLPK